MMTPAELADTLDGCILCHRRPIVSVGLFLPVNDAAYAAVMRLREEPLRDGCTPTLGYGLCQKHSRRLKRSARLVEAKILAAAAEMTIQ